VPPPPALTNRAEIEVGIDLVTLKTIKGRATGLRFHQEKRRGM
jgi:hypothetical protein